MSERPEREPDRTAPGPSPGDHDESPPPNQGGSASRPDQAAEPSNPMVTASRAIRHRGIEDARRLATNAARVALENKARDVAVLDVSEQSAEFDFFVLATGASRRQLHAISEQVDDALEKGLGEKRLGIEGYQESNWIVLDYASVVIHLFDEETREYYDLESLWADAKSIPLAELGLAEDGSWLPGHAPPEAPPDGPPDGEG